MLRCLQRNPDKLGDDFPLIGFLAVSEPDVVEGGFSQVKNFDPPELLPGQNRAGQAFRAEADAHAFDAERQQRFHVGGLGFHDGLESGAADDIPVSDAFVYGVYADAVLFCNIRNQYKRNLF